MSQQTQDGDTADTVGAKTSVRPRPQRAAGKIGRTFDQVRDALPDLGVAGSRSSQLHAVDGEFWPSDAVTDSTGLGAELRLRLHIASLLGVVGTLMMAFGGLGAGAFPVVHNPYWNFPGVSILARMLHTTTVMVFVGVLLLVVAWLLLGSFCRPSSRRPMSPIPVTTLWRIFFLWISPLLLTTPMFTQDIYSYLAQGSITARGWDPYEAGPIDLLGIDDPLARSVPLMWSHSPSPYGPTAMGYSAVISWFTQDSIIWGIFAHRIVNVFGLVLAGWALVRLACRCGVVQQTALWFSILNPLTVLHLVGGIHNESLMLGLLLVGMELTLRGVDSEQRPIVSRWLLIVLGLVSISCAGMIKVTAFIALGFAGVAVAIWLGGSWKKLLIAAGFTAAVAVFSAVGMSALTGVGFGWMSSQGGAVEVISWMSLSTVIGLASALMSSLLGLGDHQDAALALFRTLGMLFGLFWILRMLLASFRQRIHPLGGLGIATLLLVLFFPVVHPWYILWAVFPLAAWANRPLFHRAVIGYSLLFSLAILPRGLALPPSTVGFIYLMVVLVAAVLGGAVWLLCRKYPLLRDALANPAVAKG